MSNTNNEITDNLVEQMNNESIDNDKEIKTAKKRTTRSTKNTTDKVERNIKTTRSRKVKSEESLESNDNGKVKSNATATKTKTTAKERAKKTTSTRTSNTKSGRSKKAVKKENTTTLEKVKDFNIINDSVNLYNIIGESEIKLIPFVGEKNIDKYPINVVLKNLGYEKEVIVRYTTDNWNSYSDIPLNFKYQENELEKWYTEIQLKDDEVSNFQYVIKYNVNNWTYWDNNGENNYKF